MAEKSTLDKIKDMLNLSASTKSYTVNFYAEATLEDGRIIATEDEKIGVDSIVRVINDDGAAEPLASGTYALADGTKITVNEDSVITAFGEGGVEDVEEDDVEMEAEEVVEEIKEDSVVEEVAEAINEGTPDEVTEEVARKAAEIAVDKLADKVEEAVDEVYDEVSEPEEMSKEVEVETFSAVANLIDEKFEELNKRLSALEEEPGDTGIIQMASDNKAKKVALANMTMAQRVKHIMESN